MLRHVADIPANLFGLFLNVEARDAGRPRRRRNQPAEHSYDGGLARAVRAEKAEYLAALDRKADIIDGREVAELFCQPVDFDRCGHAIS